MAFSPDSKTLLTGCADKTARLWDATTGRPIGPPFAQGTAECVAFSPDGRTVLTGPGGSNDGRVQLWDVISRTAIGLPFKHQGLLSSVSLSPDRDHRMW